MNHVQLAGKKDLVRVVTFSLVASAVFLIVILWLGRYVADHATGPAIRWLVVFTGIALTAVAVVAMRSMSRMDELQRKIHAEAMAFAFLFSVLLVAAYIFLNAAGLGTPPMHWLLPAMMSCWAIGVLLAFRRYR